ATPSHHRTRRAGPCRHAGPDRLLHRRTHRSHHPARRPQLLHLPQRHLPQPPGIRRSGGLVHQRRAAFQEHPLHLVQLLARRAQLGFVEPEQDALRRRAARHELLQRRRAAHRLLSRNNVGLHQLRVQPRPHGAQRGADLVQRAQQADVPDDQHPAAVPGPERRALVQVRAVPADAGADEQQRNLHRRRRILVQRHAAGRRQGGHSAPELQDRAADAIRAGTRAGDHHGQHPGDRDRHAQHHGNLHRFVGDVPDDRRRHRKQDWIQLPAPAGRRRRDVPGSPL
ncbi:MAG: sugar-non-specific nuclease NucA homolog, partial [uncultured Gemmatimonadetes bacterium]